MTAWLKQASPPDGPPSPPRIDVRAMAINIAQVDGSGEGLPPAAEFLRDFGPRPAYDRWGQPLPLSSQEQDRLDRMVAVLVSPDARGTALLHSGQLVPSEVAAIKTVHPEVWADMIEKAVKDMGKAGPPFAPWAESTLSVLFEKPASEIYGQTEEEPHPSQGGSPPHEQRFKGTPADRRELAIREQ